MRPGDRAMATFAWPADRVDALPRAGSFRFEVALLGDDLWLDPSCGCWVDHAVPWTVDRRVTASVGVPLPGFGEVGAHNVEARWVDDDSRVLLGIARAAVVEVTDTVAWGDLHAHSGLSHDGCEDPDGHDCPSNGIPGDTHFAEAASLGLDFAALTDHAEWVTWRDRTTRDERDIWDTTLEYAQAAEGSGVVPIVGYEWTAAYSELGVEGAVGGHRTVLFEDLAPCRSYRLASGPLEVRKPKDANDVYLASAGPYLTRPADLLDALTHAGGLAGCAPTRYVSYFHHPAYDPPAYVKWESPSNQDLGDRLVEIYSEHGSSECADVTVEGCDWNVNLGLFDGANGYYQPDGSVQAALMSGLPLGFVGGTDNHLSMPGYGLATGHPGFTAGIDGPILAFAPGSVTGVVIDTTLDRAAVFDALEARRTLAASWMLDDVRIVAVGFDGSLNHPGADVAPQANPLMLAVSVQDAVQGVRVELVGADGTVWLDEDGPDVQASFDLVDGEARYVRIRFWVGDTEHRLWASPFFGDAP